MVLLVPVFVARVVASVFTAVVVNTSTADEDVISTLSVLDDSLIDD